MTKSLRATTTVRSYLTMLICLLWAKRVSLYDPHPSLRTCQVYPLEGNTNKTVQRWKSHTHWALMDSSVGRTAGDQSDLFLLNCWAHAKTEYEAREDASAYLKTYLNDYWGCCCCCSCSRGVWSQRTIFRLLERLRVHPPIFKSNACIVSHWLPAKLIVEQWMHTHRNIREVHSSACWGVPFMALLSDLDEEIEDHSWQYLLEAIMQRWVQLLHTLALRRI